MGWLTNVGRSAHYHLGVTDPISCVSKMIMKGLAIVAVSAFVALTVAQLKTAQIVGDWEGESKCVNLTASPGCHDEHVIYHIASIANKPNQVRINADRIANNKPVAMGEIIFTVDGKASTIANEMVINGNKLYWDFVVKGDKMSGTLKNGDKVVVRRISLTAHKKG